MSLLIRLERMLALCAALAFTTSSDARPPATIEATLKAMYPNAAIYYLFSDPHPYLASGMNLASHIRPSAGVGATETDMAT